MKKDKNEKQKDTLNSEEECKSSCETSGDACGCNTKAEEKNSQNNNVKELDDVKSQLESKSKQCDEYMGMLQRMAAEFDNYKKRTAKEKESICGDVTSDVVAVFLPVVDSLERALSSAQSAEGVQSIKEGIELVYRQLKDVMANLGVEEIKSVGENFDPQIHNAVMHITDEAYGESSVVEEFQKGYTLKGKVIRYSMVKVAN